MRALYSQHFPGMTMTAKTLQKAGDQTAKTAAGASGLV